jgi:hypothetical protein
VRTVIAKKDIQKAVVKVNLNKVPNGLVDEITLTKGAADPIHQCVDLD